MNGNYFHKNMQKKMNLKSNETIKTFKIDFISSCKIHLAAMPGNSHIQFIFPTFDSWLIETGLLNSQGQVNRSTVVDHISKEINSPY